MIAMQYLAMLTNVKNIIYEDKEIIVVNKPAGLPSQPTVDRTRTDLFSLLKQMLAERDHLPIAQVYLGMHHRLDKDTSGAILFTKQKQANVWVSEAFQNRKVEKQYLAITEGNFPKEPIRASHYLRKKTGNKKGMQIVKSGGQSALTDFMLLDQSQSQGGSISLVLAKPLTGRMHQIRIQLAELGHPVLGDRLYGRNFVDSKRVLLHAWKLRIKEREWIAPIPEDFKKYNFHWPRN